MYMYKICVLVKVLVNVPLQCWIPSHCLLCCDNFLLFSAIHEYDPSTHSLNKCG